MVKRLLGLFLAFALICALLPVAVLTASAESYSGTCGDNLTWTLDTENGVLEIFGTGDMNNYISYKNNPWYSYRQGIKCIIIGNGVASIGDHAFNGCGGLTSITIPDSVTSIGDYAFSWCEELTSITIPDSVTGIGDYAFYGCTGLTSVTISDSVTSIGEDCFSWCYALESVVLGNGITRINDGMFAYDPALSNIVIPDSVTGIGDYAFYDCTGLTSITIPDSVASIGDAAFCGCSGLTSVTIPDSVTSIGDYAFSWCEELTSITIPDSVTGIGDYAFSSCHALTSVTIPDSVTSIGDAAFSGCSGLKSITVDENNTVYDSRESCNAIIETTTNTLIAGCENTAIPDSVTSIGDYAFYDCTGLTSITIPDSVASIGNDAFSGCSGLTSVTIPGSVTSIGDAAFNSCSALTSVTIPGSVTSIGNYAFQNCTGLTDVYYFGSEAGWNRITIGSNNTPLTGATIHYLAEGLAINTASLTLYEDIVVNFTASVPEGVTDPYMVIEMNGQSYTLQASREDDQGRLVFEFMNLTPDKMGDNIKATLYAYCDGTLVEYCKPEYSVKQYCTNVMAAYPDNQKLQTLLSDMLVYGAATQQFTGHNTDSLVTEGVDLSAASTFTDLTSTDFTRTGTADDNIQWTGAGLECGSRMSMYFTLNTTAGEATSVEVTINGRTTIYSYSDMTVVDESDFGATCRVVFRGISACEYGDTVTAILKNNGEQVGQTLTYSVNSYVYSKQHDTAVENLAQLVQAIYNYGASARNYLS